MKSLLYCLSYNQKHICVIFRREVSLGQILSITNEFFFCNRNRTTAHLRTLNKEKARLIIKVIVIQQCMLRNWSLLDLLIKPFGPQSYNISSISLDEKFRFLTPQQSRKHPRVVLKSSNHNQLGICQYLHLIRGIYLYELDMIVLVPFPTLYFF